MRKIAGSFWLVAGLAGLAVSPVRAGDLGAAGNYNAFIFQNMNQTSDSEGPVAVGGNLTLSTYSVASTLTSGANLVVGGNLNVSGGTINGDVYVGGTATFTGGDAPTGNVYVGGAYSNTVAPGGTVYYAGTFSGPTSYGTSQHVSSVTLPIDFAAAQTALTQTSDSLNNLTPTGTYNVLGSTLTFTGSGLSQNIFSIPAAALAGVTELDIDIPSSAAAVINITGSSVTLPSGGFSYAAPDANVLFNLAQASTITMHGFDGSILAPLATVNFSSGDLDGTLVANNLDPLTTGGGELLFDPFTQTITVPLPASAMGGVVLLGVMALGSRRAGPVV